MTKMFLAVLLIPALAAADVVSETNVPFTAKHKYMTPNVSVSTNFYGSTTGIVTKAYVEGLGIDAGIGKIEATNISEFVVGKYDETNLTARINAKQDEIDDYTTTNAVKAIVSSPDLVNTGAVVVAEAYADDGLAEKVGTDTFTTATNVLATAITNKADKSELAGYLPLAGGTMTGEIFSKQTVTQGQYGQYGFTAEDADGCHKATLIGDGVSVVQYSGTERRIQFPDLDGTFALTSDIPTIPSTTALLKGNGSGGIVAATADSDYLTPNTANANFVPWVTDKNGNKTAVTIGRDRYGTVGVSSMLVGQSSTASGDYSLVFGSGSTATGYGSTILSGDNSEAFGVCSFACGKWAHAYHNFSFVWNGTDVDTYSRTNGTFTINPVGGISGFYIGEQNLSQINAGILSSAENTAGTIASNLVDHTNVRFSNEVLAVGLGIGTNEVAQINAILTDMGETPIGEATTIGALLAALAAAVAWIKKKSVKKDSNGYYFED